MDEVNLVLVVEPNVSRSLQRRSFGPSPSSDSASRSYSIKPSQPRMRPETFGLCNLLFVIRYSDICSWTTLLLRHMVFDISSLFYLPLRLLLFWFLKMPKTTLILRHLLFKTFAIQDICFSDICYSDICSSVLQSLF